jgi:asparagine synthase (glutamine-hydrolysing)
MCGIVGVFNYANGIKVEPGLLENMLLSINHRGPDERGLYVNKNMGIGNVRLSIIDIATGQQPLSDTSGNFWVVFNGEIFNYIEIRKELEQKGYSFKTKSDTEVIVAAYAVWGKQFVSKLNGQFAFAIWDKQNKNLFLARDRVGICPLFYANINGSFVFGSEIKAILQNPAIKPEISTSSLSELFTYWTAITPSTLFKNIFEVTPGHWLSVSHDKIQSEAYWKLHFPEKQNYQHTNVNEAREELKEILSDAVRIRLRADVPVAAYLSGGLDSTTTTALIKSIEPSVLNTFSIGFNDTTYDETAYQQEASKFLNTNHRSINCSNEDISEVFPKVIWHAESPMLRTAPAPMFNLSRFVRGNNIKVVITGEGADEMLAGYDIFKEMIIRRFWARYPDSKYRPLLLKKLYPYIPQISNANALTLKFFYGYKLTDVNVPYYSHIMRWNNGRHILKYLHASHRQNIDGFDPYQNWINIKPEGFDNWGDLAKAQYLESTLFMSGYLLSSQGDRMTMANSVEGRYPFLDHRFIEFTTRLPEGLKMHGLNEKYLLKKMMENKIPESISKRPKQAYRAPIRNAFFAKNNIDYVTHLLDNKTIGEFGIFDTTVTSKLIEKVKTSGITSEIENMSIMALISTQLFYQFFILGKHPFSAATPSSRMRIIEEN